MLRQIDNSVLRRHLYLFLYVCLISPWLECPAYSKLPASNSQSDTDAIDFITINDTTVEIEFVLFRHMGMGTRDLSEDAANQFVEDAADLWSTNSRVDDLVNLSRKVIRPAAKYPEEWVQGMMRQKPGKYRCRLVSGLTETTLFDENDYLQEGTLQINYAGGKTNQLSFFRNTGWNVYRPSKLFPYRTNINSLQNGKLLEDGTTHYQFDVTTASGEVVGKQSVDVDVIKKLVVREQILSRFRRYAKYEKYELPTKIKLNVPTFSAQIESSTGFVSLLELFLITAVKFPVEIPEKDFAISVPPATTAVLFANKSMQETEATIRSKEPVSDARELFPKLMLSAEKRKNGQ